MSLHGEVQFVIITGLSGAGKTQALHSLEDLGYFCVDNLPPALIPTFAELCLNTRDPIQRVALVIDIRGGEFFKSAVEALEQLTGLGVTYEILFLEADDDTLIRRYKETRRRHPLAPEGRLIEGIAKERRLLDVLRQRAAHIIDTSELTPRDLREQVVRLLSGGTTLRAMHVHFVSFGFKYGLPLDADLVFDVRFLPNPHYVDHLKPLTGNDTPVDEYVMGYPLARTLLRKLEDLLRFLLPNYVAEGKTQVTIAIGCTGGQHRSVVLANRLSRQLKDMGFDLSVQHRDAGRDLAEGEDD